MKEVNIAWEELTNSETEVLSELLEGGLDDLSFTIDEQEVSA